MKRDTPNERPTGFEYHWHSTPQLWSAVRPGYDGAPDSRCKMGFGKTKDEAAVDLIDQEDAPVEALLDEPRTAKELRSLFDRIAEASPGDYPWKVDTGLMAVYELGRQDGRNGR